MLTNRPLMALDALEVLPVVLAIAAPLMDSGAGNLADTVAGVAKLLASKEHKGALRELVTAFIKSTVAKSPSGQTTEMDEATFNAIFSGHYPDLIKWVSVHIKVNFADFFPTPTVTPQDQQASR